MHSSKMTPPMIGKTRQADTPSASSQTLTVLAGVGPPRGVLRSAPGAGQFRHERHAPAAALVDLVEHYWMVAWDLRGEPPQRRETLPHPSVHLLIEHGETRIAGVASARFSRLLEGAGWVFGIKFKPAGFRPFFAKPLSALTDRSCRLDDVFGADAVLFEQRIVALAPMLDRVKAANDFLLARLPAHDPEVARVNAIVHGIVDDRGMSSVAALASRHRIGKRNLQRLFSDYVGVSPKWVIMRYRLHEALEQLAAGRPADWPALALSLGYFDQAHFIRDFKRMVGRAPSDYVRDA